MTKTIEDLFILLGTLSDLFPIFLLLIYFPLLKREVSFKILAIGCSAFFLLNSINYFDSTFINAIVYPLFTLCEFTFVALFLRQHIRSVLVKKLLIVSIVLFFSFICLEFVFVPFKGLDSVPIAVESLIILNFSFYYLYEQMNDVNDQFIYNKYHFWIIVGLMIYLAGSFFIYVFANQIDQSMLQQWWIITIILYIIKNIFFFIGVLLLIKHSKKSLRPHHTYTPYLN